MNVKVWENKYEIKSKRIEDMWNMYEEDMLKEIGIKVYEVKENKIILKIWMKIQLEVIEILKIIMVDMWKLEVLKKRIKKDDKL